MPPNSPRPNRRAPSARPGRPSQSGRPARAGGSGSSGRSGTRSAGSGGAGRGSGDRGRSGSGAGQGRTSSRSNGGADRRGQTSARTGSSRDSSTRAAGSSRSSSARPGSARTGATADGCTTFGRPETQWRVKDEERCRAGTWSAAKGCRTACGPGPGIVSGKCWSGLRFTGANGLAGRRTGSTRSGQEMGQRCPSRRPRGHPARRRRRGVGIRVSSGVATGCPLLGRPGARTPSGHAEAEPASGVGA